jgi:hypothetical protein
MTQTAVDFSLTGKVCLLDYGDLVYEYDFRAPGKLTYTCKKGPAADRKETVDITVSRIRDDIFAVTFQDAGATMISIEDVANHIVNTILVAADHTTYHLQAKLSYV